MSARRRRGETGYHGRRRNGLDMARSGFPPFRAIAFALAIGALPPAAFGAACPSHAFTAPADVRLKGDSVLIVTHATAFHDARYASKPGVDAAVRFAKSHAIPVVYLQDDESPGLYYADDCRPDYWVRSQDGELGFDLPPNVLVAGGHLELCLSTTVHEVMSRWSRQPVRHHSLVYLMDAIYSNGKWIEASDPWHDEFNRFMGIVSYGRPGGEAWPKVTLLETMGVLGRLSRERDYLRRILPHWERTFGDDVRIKVKLHGTTREVLREGAGGRAMTIAFHFVESAAELDESASPGQ